MKVLLTGAFGNIGQHTITQLLNKGHQVRCLDLDTKANRRTAGEFKGRVETLWGDVSNRASVEAAVRGQDAVIHLAWITDIAWSETHVEEARKVNVGGTVNTIEALKAGLSQGRKLVFISSAGVFGRTQHLPNPREASDPVSPALVYSRHKVECEELVKNSGLEWSILRLAFAPPIKPGRLDLAYVLFIIPLDARFEFVDPRDAALAIANSVASNEVWQKTLLIGGGSRSQMPYREYLRVAMGYLGPFPEGAFALPGSPTPMDWLDTTESQRLLKYQNLTAQDFVRDQRAAMGAGRYLLPLVAPLIRRQLLKQSPYCKASRQKAARRAA